MGYRPARRRRARPSRGWSRRSRPAPDQGGPKCRGWPAGRPNRYPTGRRGTSCAGRSLRGTSPFGCTTMRGGPWARLTSSRAAGTSSRAITRPTLGSGSRLPRAYRLERAVPVDRPGAAAELDHQALLRRSRHVDRVVRVPAAGGVNPGARFAGIDQAPASGRLPPRTRTRWEACGSPRRVRPSARPQRVKAWCWHRQARPLRTIGPAPAGRPGGPKRLSGARSEPPTPPRPRVRRHRHQ